MVTALVENAISHTPESGRIDVTVSATSRKVRIWSGTPALESWVSNPTGYSSGFARGGPAGHNSARHSYGIGLALVKDAALRHGGDVTVGETGTQGTVLNLELPVA
jgi:signal transduction histidine kinase